jgi:hypothetical protein
LMKSRLWSRKSSRSPNFPVSRDCSMLFFSKARESFQILEQRISASFAY